MVNAKIREWYTSAYPTDELGFEINESVSFKDLFDALDNYQDVYNLMGVHDSIVRERVFERLAEIMNVDYSYIYDQWLKGDD